MELINIELYMFLAQQKLNHLVFENMNHITVLRIVILFTSGILTSFNPCMFSTLPLTLVYMSKKRDRNLYYFNFISGLVLSILIASSVFLTVQHSYLTMLNVLPVVKPVFLTIVVLSLLEVIAIPEILTKLFPLNDYFNFMPSSFFFVGFCVGLTLSRCSAPIFITLLAWITYTRKLLIGLFLLSIYISGYIFPILVSMISIHLLKKIHFWSIQIYEIIPFCGFFVTTAGIFSVFHFFLSTTNI